ncbi:alkaline ceramidase 3 [Eurytemora carolleeae]|uniref:alkaline ceramidase 3 n=1 Tax=Eurytemora carolleeae TaxID=1294199 RepID=UPI000C75658C|nr:alkaline ceramidase 3 [Eurytemora carolleeae]XP_023335418.1 alkaline ceramidase 3 [Eurytemora carolleeae]|eukprot:XP_023335409.1 alkaline ceramidase 3-like [Eurytemora affinis]
MPSVIQERMGVWGERTASIDWCESNYEITPWIAEFWNTISNLAMIIPSLYGCFVVLTQGLETRYLISYLFFLTVGIGSWMFHMTLQYSMQLLDELPMIYTTCLFIYLQAMIKEGPGKHNKLLICCLAGYAIFFTALYSVWSNPLVMEYMYAFVIVILLGQSVWLLYQESNPACLRVFIVGTALYAVAFLIWNIDNHFCSHLQEFRKGKSTGVAALSQLHAWWHLLAGYSTYLHILFSSHFRLSMLKRNPKFVICPIGLSVVTSP